MLKRRIKRVYKRFLKPVVKPCVKWSRKRLPVVSAFCASFPRRPANFLYLPAWIGSLLFPKVPLTAHVPNWPYTATHYLALRLRPKAVVFEYGGGGSTLWLARRVKSLTTVEHHPDWFTRIDQELTRSGTKNCVLLLRAPRMSAPASNGTAGERADYRSSLEEGTFEDYVKAIEPFPDGHFDVVLVDGRCRPACLLHAARKVLPGGLLVLDDSHRERYQGAMASLRSWARKDFCGIKPFRWQLGYTTCWIKPKVTAERDWSAPALLPARTATE